MAWRIVKQPNGKYARWADVVDDFTDYDMTSIETLELCQKFVGEDLAAIKFVGSHLAPSQFEECIDTIREVHGNEVAESRRRDMSTKGSHDES